VRGIGGTPSTGDLRVHFGLGDATNVTTLRIEWPSGIVQERTNVAANQILTITEPAQMVPLGPREFQIRCWKGRRFEVQKSHDLQTWDSLGTVINATGTSTFQASVGGGPPAGGPPRPGGGGVGGAGGGGGAGGPRGVGANGRVRVRARRRRPGL